MKLIQGAVLALLFVGASAQAGVRYHCETPAGSNRDFDDLTTVIDFRVGNVVRSTCPPGTVTARPEYCRNYVRRGGTATVTDATGETHRLVYASERALPDGEFMAYSFVNRRARDAEDLLVLYVRLGAPESSAFVYQVYGLPRATQQTLNCEILH